MLACAGASMQQGPTWGRLQIKELTLGKFCMSGQLVNRHQSIYLGLNLADMQETQVGMYLGLDVLAGSADVDNGRQHLCRQPRHDNHSSRAAMIVQPGVYFATSLRHKVIAGLYEAHRFLGEQMHSKHVAEAQRMQQGGRRSVGQGLTTEAVQQCMHRAAEPCKQGRRAP